MIKLVIIDDYDHQSKSRNKIIIRCEMDREMALHKKSNFGGMEFLGVDFSQQNTNIFGKNHREFGEPV